MTIKEEAFLESLEKLNKGLETARWAFLAYGNKIGFKDQDKFADEEVAKVESLVKSAIDKAYKQGALDMAEAVKLNKKDTLPFDDVIEDSKILSFNQAIDEMEQKSAEFLKKIV